MYKEKDYFHPENGNTGTCNVNANGVIADNRVSAKDAPLAPGGRKVPGLIKYHEGKTGASNSAQGTSLQVQAKKW